MNIKFLILLVLFSVFSYSKNTCVADLQGSQEISEDIVNNVYKVMAQMGYSQYSIDNNIDFFQGGPKALVRCLEGDYQDVTLIVHSVSKNNSKFKFAAKNQFKEVKLVYKTKNDRPKNLSLNIFRNFTGPNNQMIVGKNIKQFTLITCDSESFIDNVDQNKDFLDFIDYNNLNLKLISSDSLDNPLIQEHFYNTYKKNNISIKDFSSDYNKYKKKLSNIKISSIFTTVLAISENAQDLFRPYFYCLVDYNVNFQGLISSISNSCLRDNYKIKIYGKGFFNSKSKNISMLKFDRNKIPFGLNKTNLSFFKTDLPFQYSYGRGGFKQLFLDLNRVIN